MAHTHTHPLVLPHICTTGDHRGRERERGGEGPGSGKGHFENKKQSELRRTTNISYMHKNPLRSLFQKGDLSRAKDMDKDTERVRTEQPTDRTFLHKITICIKILILLIFPCHLFTYTYVWHVFSTNFSSFFCTLKHEKNFKWPEKGPQPKELPELPEMFRPFAVFVFYFPFFLRCFFFFARLCFVKSLNIIFPFLLGRCKTFREFQMSRSVQGGQSCPSNPLAAIAHQVFRA